MKVRYSYWEIFYNPDIPLHERVAWAAASPVALPLAALSSLSGCSVQPDRPQEYPYAYPDARDAHIQDNDVEFDTTPRVLKDKDAISTDVSPAQCTQMKCLSGLLVGPPKGTQRYCMSFTEVHKAMGLEQVGPLLGASVADVNQDKRPDVYLFPEDISNVLYLNQSTGFSNAAASLGLDIGGDTRAAAWGDFDQDSKLDVALMGDSGTVLYRRDNLKYQIVPNPSGIHDNNPARTGVWLGAHLLVATDNGTRFFKHTSGTDFVQEAESSGLWDPGRGSKFAVADYDGDGLLDVYLANLTGKNRLFHALSATQFESVEDKTQTTTIAQAQSMDAEWVSGAKGLYVANWNTTNHYYIQASDGSHVFSDMAKKLSLQDSGHTMRAAWGNVVWDAHPFLWLGRWGEVPLLYMPQFNEAGGVIDYLDVSVPMGMSVPPSSDDGPIVAEWRDFNQDGMTDLLVAMASGAIYLYQNSSHWVETCGN